MSKNSTDLREKKDSKQSSLYLIFILEKYLYFTIGGKKVPCTITFSAKTNLINSSKWLFY